jgi:hypothetical protein
MADDIAFFVEITVPTLKQIVREHKLGKTAGVVRMDLIRSIRTGIHGGNLTEDDVLGYLECQKEAKRNMEKVRLDHKLLKHSQNLNAMALLKPGQRVYWLRENDGFHGHSGKHHFGIIKSFTEDGFCYVELVHHDESQRAHPGLDSCYVYQPKWDMKLEMTGRFECRELRPFDEKQRYTIQFYQ